jgi:hypothetical protein
VCIVVLASGEALAWGRTAHRIISAVTEKRLTPAARAGVRDLLEPDETLARASLWADDHRQDHPGSAAWHYVNVPIGEPRYDSRFCPSSGCIVSKIHELRVVLGNAALPRSERQLALRLLVHFIEDVHQPLHVGDRGDRGGNDLQVRFFGSGTNLHRLWDEGIVLRHDSEEASWIARIDAAANFELSRQWSKCDVATWADESLAAARQAYVMPGSGSALEPGAKLGQEYFEFALPIVERRLAQAAVRLAATLNQVFAAK